MSRPTDHVNLDLWQLHEDIAFGRAGGKMIWQPRILAWFTDRRFENRPLPPPYTGMSDVDVYRSLGCSNRLYDDYNPCFKWVDPQGVTRKDVEIDADHICKVIETPRGTLTEIVRKTPNSWVPHRRKVVDQHARRHARVHVAARQRGVAMGSGAI